MTLNRLLQIGLFFLMLLALVKPLGWYMARVYEGRPTLLDPVLGPIERTIYRLGAVRATEEMDWKTYSAVMLLFSAAGFFALPCNACKRYFPSIPTASGRFLRTWPLTPLSVMSPTPTGRRTPANPQ